MQDFEIIQGVEINYNFNESRGISVTNLLAKLKHDMYALKL